MPNSYSHWNYILHSDCVDFVCCHADNSPELFSSMLILWISWISIIASILSGLLTVLLAARSPAKRAAKVSPLTAVSRNAGQTASFRKAADTKAFNYP